MSTYPIFLHQTHRKVVGASKEGIDKDVYERLSKVNNEPITSWDFLYNTEYSQYFYCGV